MKFWSKLTLVERIRRLKVVIPLALVPVVVIYQLVIAIRLEAMYGHPLHYTAEIAFYSLIGPLVTWLTLNWVERRLAEKEALEHEVQARTRQINSLTEASSDAILSLDRRGFITSWNRGAAKMFGYPPEQAIGLGIDSLLPDQKQMLREDDLADLETTAITQDGRQLSVSLSQTRMAGSGYEHEPVRLLILRDFTTRQERMAILDEERERITRDLHDGVAQTLYFLALKADAARKLLPEQPIKCETNLKEIGQNARKAIREVRQAILGLTPWDWEQSEFSDALRTFCSRFGEQMDWELSVQIDESINTIAKRLQTILFRVVQESLNNAAKHSQATSIAVKIEATPTDLRLRVRDNGIGFAFDRANKGLGLSQMKNRTEAVGGVFEVGSNPGEGTTIKAHFALKGNNHE